MKREILIKFGEKVREERTKLGLSQEALASRAGVHRTFVPVCEHCGRFVRADKDIMVNGLDDVSDAPNATCAKCGRIKMPFEGWL